MRYLLVVLAACGAARPDTAPGPKLGLIAGLARDKNSGQGLEHAEIVVTSQVSLQRAHASESGAHGVYQVEGLAAGTYTLDATYAGQRLTISNIDVGAGQATFVDLPFTPGDPAPYTFDFRAQGEGPIEYFTTPVPRIEGTVTETETHARVVGAVVTAAAEGHEDDALQTVTDDAGRFHFEPVPVGTYSVSAYYTVVVGGHGQIEIRRGGITIGEGKGALVPLVIDTTK